MVQRSRKKSIIALPNQPIIAVESDVTHDTAAQLLGQVQYLGKDFRGFSEEEIECLAEHFSVMSFEEGQTVISRGEAGTWFGVLLSGTLELAFDGTVHEMHPGLFLGEMALLEKNSIRTATLTGGKAGLIGTMLCQEIPALVEAHTEAGAKLLRIIATIAIRKQLQIMRRVRAAKLSKVTWATAKSMPTECRNKMHELLVHKGFDEEEAAILADGSHFKTFQKGQAPQQPSLRMSRPVVVLRPARVDVVLRRPERVRPDAIRSVPPGRRCCTWGRSRRTSCLCSRAL